MLSTASIDLSAQQKTIDSLENVLRYAKEDTNKVILYRNLCFYTDSLVYAQEGLKLSEKLNYTKGKALSLECIAIINYAEGKYDISLDYFIKAMKLAESSGNKRLLAEIYKFIGFIYRPNDPNIATEYYAKSLRIFSELHDELSESYLYSAIGNVYEGTSGIGEKNKNGRKHNALEYYLKSLEIREKIGRPGEIASSLNETSRVYELLGKRKEAAELREKGLLIAEKAGSLDNIIYLSNLMAQEYFKKKDFKKALEYQLRAYKIVHSDKNTNYSILGEVAQGLASTYTALGDYKKAAEFFQLNLACNDSVKARVNNVNLINLKFTLSNEREKQHLSIKDAEIDKQKAIVDKQIILRNSFLAGLGLVIALGVFIFRSYREKQKTNRELDLKNKKIEFAYLIIEEKTKSITDSIRYALRIQRATLPHRRDIWAALHQSFVLYKPKDIVSGDFYWFAKKEQTVFIAAADCTGHGVPGAFMSIIGSEKLNDAVRNENNPSEILSQLNIGIKTALRQSESVESTRDGMDIALCSIDLTSNILNYAGANRPLWIIRKNSTEVEEIKAVKTAIGGLTEASQHFDTHTLKLFEGDTFFIFSDGYADQDGGEKGKKLMTKKFKEMLVSIQSKTLKEQEAYLDSYFDKWRGNKQQLDDILVIGVRI